MLHPADEDYYFIHRHITSDFDFANFDALTDLHSHLDQSLSRRGASEYFETLSPKFAVSLAINNRFFFSPLPKLEQIECIQLNDSIF